MTNEYFLLKSLHLLGVVIFLGNIIITAWWKVMADQTGKPDIIAYAQKQVTLTDFIFTATGVILIAVTGTIMAHKYFGPDYLHVKWIAWGLGLFIASGVIWLTVLMPVQIKQARLAKEFAITQKIPKLYWRLNTIWTVFGITATILPLINLYWMVFKPH